MDNSLYEQCPKIQALDRILEIPSVNYLWNKSSEAYIGIKTTNILTNWAFGTVEKIMSVVIEKSTPVTKLIEKPIHTLDRRLCQGINYIETNLPSLKEEPQQIINRARSAVSYCLHLALQNIIEFRDGLQHRVRIILFLTYYKIYYFQVYIWDQADQVMSTKIGGNILQTVDSITNYVEWMLDKYLPPSEEEYRCDPDHVCSEHVKLHHTVIRLSDFGSRASKRIYYALTERLQHMYKIEICLLVLHTIFVVQVIKFIETIMTFILKIISDNIFFY